MNEMNGNILQVRELRTQFFTEDGAVAALDGLSFDVAAGEMLGLVGESGCGKSTALLSIMRLVPSPGRIVAGSINLDGRDILALSDRQMRSLRGPVVSMVFQDALAALNPTMKVGKQVVEPLRTHMKMSSVEARKEAIQLLARVGIPSPEERLHAYPHEFSGGMRQRVMIAIALTCRPKLLLADEPTTGLDVTIQRQILDLMSDLRAETGAGVILVTHDIGVVAQICDRAIVMYAGQMVESGHTEKVLRQPRHPYTIGLLNSTLELDRDREKPLRSIPGLPPDLIDMPPGCLFWPRCPRQTAICQEQRPAMQSVGAGHDAACWHMEEQP